MEEIKAFTRKGKVALFQDICLLKLFGLSSFPLNDIIAVWLTPLFTRSVSLFNELHEWLSAVSKKGGT